MPSLAQYSQQHRATNANWANAPFERFPLAPADVIAPAPGAEANTLAPPTDEQLGRIVGGNGVVRQRGAPFYTLVLRNTAADSTKVYVQQPGSTPVESTYTSPGTIDGVLEIPQIPADALVSIEGANVETFPAVTYMVPQLNEY